MTKSEDRVSNEFDGTMVFAARSASETGSISVRFLAALAALEELTKLEDRGI